MFLICTRVKEVSKIFQAPQQGPSCVVQIRRETQRGLRDIRNIAYILATMTTGPQLFTYLTRLLAFFSLYLYLVTRPSIIPNLAVPVPLSLPQTTSILKKAGRSYLVCMYKVPVWRRGGGWLIIFIYDFEERAYPRAKGA